MFSNHSIPEGEIPKLENVSQKAKRSSKNHKNLIYGACALGTLLIVATATWAILFFFNRPAIDDEFFVSDNTKTTISISPTGSNASFSHQTRVVYDYDGENVVGMKTYFEYKDEESAKKAYESLKDQPEFKGAELNGKYIIVTADESQYKGLTASDVEQQAAAIQAYQAQFSISDDSENTNPEDNN